MPEYRKLSETIKDLEHYDGTYKRESVDAATGLKDEISPVLIKKGKTRKKCRKLRKRRTAGEK